MPQPTMLQLVRCRPIADVLVPCLLADALGVLALYAICQDDAGVKVAIMRMFITASSQNDGDDSSMVRAMYAAVNVHRTMRRTYGTHWNGVPAMLVFHACELRDGPFLQGIHSVLDVRYMNIMDLSTSAIRSWIDGTCDKTTYGILECLYRREMVLDMTKLTPQREDQFVRILTSYRGIKNVYTYSQQIECYEFFRVRPDRFKDVSRGLAQALRSYNCAANDKMHMLNRFIASSCPSPLRDDIAGHSKLLDECRAIVLDPLVNNMKLTALPCDFPFGLLPSGAKRPRPPDS